ncbi:MAG: formylglycine-generating enzyme family protein [Gemmatimonadota bacterium]|nr:formylglycine-generating enzyme family protein [Gemmatimonadota bacterium]
MWRKFVALSVVLSCWTAYSVYSQLSFPMPEMVVIPAGSFQMGCVSGIDCYDDEKPVREVKIDSFALSKYEVTFEEYDAFTDATGRERANDEGWGRGRRPVINVSWYDAIAYTEWLSDQTGKTYRLPSESEWEYAARAGTGTAYSWGDSIDYDRANCDGCVSAWDGEKTAPVGSFEANAWGVYDMHGNVSEWAQDCWRPSYRGVPTDGSAGVRGDCNRRLMRGGSWADKPRILRSATRLTYSSEARSIFYGFRVARSF